MKIVYHERRAADGTWEKFPVYIAETDEESKRLEAEVRRDNPGYYAGFSEVHADPNHPLHDRVKRFEEEERQRKEAAKPQSDDS